MRTLGTEFPCTSAEGRIHADVAESLMTSAAIPAWRSRASKRADH